LNAPVSASNLRARIRCARTLRAVAAALLWCLVASLAAASVSAAPRPRKSALPRPAGLDVQPFPGTPDAAPQTHIAFPALSPGQIESVTVRGSRSGAHPGRLTTMPGGHGVEFAPDRPFTNGERVSVKATLGSAADGTASGAPNSRRISFSFGVVAPLAGEAKPSASSTVGGWPTAGYAVRHDIRETSTWTHTFNSINWIHPPLVFTSGKEPDAKCCGDIFTDVHRAFVQAGPLILNPQGQLIWFDPIPDGGAGFNAQVQRYEGQQVLTYWQGYTGNGYGSGEDVILNHHYQVVATVKAGNGYQADLHEFQILPNGDALITAYAKVPNVDLTSVGGPKSGTLLDSIIQEVNIATGQVVWEWHAYGHVRLWETYAGKPQANTNTNPYDFFHINSIQMLPNGNLLVSARHTWTVYEIDMQTGKIPYNFGGKNSSFKFGPGANFEWQHDAHMLPNGTMTVFDDADGYYKSERQSRALQLNINYGKHQVTLEHGWTNKPPLLAQSQGSTQILPDGNTFVGWGAQPYATEFWKRDGGRQLFSLHYHAPMENYRAFRYGWWGQPSTPPNIATSASSSGTTVYASWNGATDVATWRVLAGPTPNKLSPVGQFPKTYFETTMSVPSTEPYFAVQALGAGGGTRATSAIVARGHAG
jgi:hypothetical protein